MAVRLGVDIGGTFTDVVALLDKKLVVAKTPTSYPDPSEGIVLALQTVLAKAGVDAAEVTGLFHGTTVATNALIERNLSKVGLMTTAGFGSVLEIGRQTRSALYDLRFAERWTPVPQELRKEVSERTTSEGEVLLAPGRSQVRLLTEELVKSGVDAICVAFVNSFASDHNEQIVAEWIREEHPEIGVWTSSSSVREFREYERFSTAVLDASLGGLMSMYLGNLRKRTASVGIASDPYIMQSSGGVVRTLDAASHPTSTLLSGPGGGLKGAIHVAKALGFQDLLTLDMGGTSADLGVVRGSVPEMVGVRKFEDVPVLGTSLAIEAIGAGGGSIAEVDAGGRLRVGPESARSVPGPAAYGKGGTRATVTDAHVVLGLLPATTKLGDFVSLDVEAAYAAIERDVAEPLSIDVYAAAQAILDIVNTNMSLAARRATIARGIDSRDLALVAYGGAGPLHAVSVAAELGVKHVIIPPHPGTLSAYGLLVADLQREFATASLSALDEESINHLSESVEQLSREAQTWRETQDEHGEYRTQPYGDLRYIGQEHTLRTELPDLPWTQETFGEIRSRFEELHRQVNGYGAEDEDLEIVNLRLLATIDVGSADIPITRSATTDKQAKKPSTVPVRWEAGTVTDTTVLSFDDLASGQVYDGPAILIQEDTTCAIPPHTTYRVEQQMLVISPPKNVQSNPEEAL